MSISTRLHLYGDWTDRGSLYPYPYTSSDQQHGVSLPILDSLRGDGYSFINTVCGSLNAKRNNCSDDKTTYVSPGRQSAGEAFSESDLGYIRDIERAEINEAG